jgi:hypothetical protein
MWDNFKLDMSSGGNKLMNGVDAANKSMSSLNSVFGQKTQTPAAPQQSSYIVQQRGPQPVQPRGYQSPAMSPSPAYGIPMSSAQAPSLAGSIYPYRNM